MKDIVPLLTRYNPKELSSGDIRTSCLHTENHTTGDGNMSMFINPDKNAYHCFSCGAKGSVVKLLTRKLGISVYEAYDYVTLDFSYLYETTEEVEEVVEKYALSDYPRGYPKDFLDRGFPKEVLDKFKIGKHLDDKDREVITVPMMEGRRVRGYKFRTNFPTRSFWYSDNFDRKMFLYNKPLDTSKACTLVEGESDVWRGHQYGYSDVTSSLGTKISKEQFRLLSRYPNVRMGFDNDFPGTLATEIAYLNLKNHTEVTFMPFRSEDPGSGNKEDWEVAYNNCIDYISYQMFMYETLDNYEEVVKRAYDNYKNR